MKKRKRRRRGARQEREWVPARTDQTRPDQIRSESEREVSIIESGSGRGSQFLQGVGIFLADGVAGDLLLSSGCCTWPWVHDKSGQDTCGHVLSLSCPILWDCQLWIDLTD